MAGETPGSGPDDEVDPAPEAPAAEAPAADHAGSTAPAAERAGSTVPSADGELPPLPPHLANRPDRPRAEADIAKGRSQARLILLLLFAALPFVVLVVVILNSLASGPPDVALQGQQDSRNEVTRYCTYKARNDGQYDDCLRRTDPRVIRVEKSNPARYARAELTRCLPDAGPRCTLR